MKRLVLAALLALSACAKQDAALDVRLQGPFRIPADADELWLDVFDGTQDVRHKAWCVNPAPGCDALTPQPALSGDVTVVESGASHAHVKLDATLRLRGAVVGQGQAVADFQPGETVSVTVALSAQ